MYLEKVIRRGVYNRRIEIHGKYVKELLVDIICQLILFYMLSYSSISGDQQILNVVIALSVVYCVFADKESIFCYVVGLSIFDYSFNINGMNATPIITCLLLIKLFFHTGSKLRISRNSLIVGILIFACELIGDRNYGSAGEIFLTLVNVGLFIVVISNPKTLNLDHIKAMILFAIPVACAIYCIVMAYGNLNAFFELMFHSAGLYRFGIGKANVQGGAMSLPLYALMMLSMSLSYFLLSERKRWLDIMLIFINAIFLLFAVLTISRSLFLGLAGVVMALLLGNKKHKQSLLFKISFVFVVVVIVVLVFWGDVVDQAFSLLINRIATDTGGAGRTDVWTTALGFLADHPLAILIGNGASIYPSLSDGLGAGCHNLWLDILMSWGLIGFVGIIFLIRRFFKKIAKMYGKADSMSYITLFAYVTFSMTALRCNSLKTWSFLLLRC